MYNYEQDKNPEIFPNQNESIEAESYLLSTLIVYPEEIKKIELMISPENFLNPLNQELFRVLLKMSKEAQGINVDHVASYIKKNTNNLVSYDYLLSLMVKPGLKSNVILYVREIIEQSKKRELEKIFNFYNSKSLVHNQQTKDIIEQVINKLTSLDQDIEIRDFESASQVVKRYYKNLQDRKENSAISGVASNFDNLDEITHGFQKGDLIILAARPSMGKTAFSLNLAFNACDFYGKKVAFFSLEMPNEHLIGRMISSLSGVAGNKLKKPMTLNEYDWLQILKAKDKIDRFNLYLDDGSTSRINDIIFKSKRMHQKVKLDMIIIDYLQLITIHDNRGDNRQNEISKISRQLKELARELQIPIIALSQLHREVEKRADKIPLMSDLRDSGSIEQDADLIMFLYREDYYLNANSKDQADQRPTVDVIIAKHRNGAIGKIQLSLDLPTGLFQKTSY
ncbi:replicative DNA helicase [Mycoplasmopsis pulmonis]|nr:replicative DNA helicase [Mycoplasmopsis pulmonis]MDZ7293475.1 replicative DNA helicase [Mycoplasmopsis pulmonis]VEU68283.1 replicative DNA helicase [Mycoplasmopsis pulmonis]